MRETASQCCPRFVYTEGVGRAHRDERRRMRWRATFIGDRLHTNDTRGRNGSTWGSARRCYHVNMHSTPSTESDVGSGVGSGHDAQHMAQTHTTKYFHACALQGGRTWRVVLGFGVDRRRQLCRCALLCRTCRRYHPPRRMLRVRREEKCEISPI